MWSRLQLKVLSSSRFPPELLRKGGRSEREARAGEAHQQPPLAPVAARTYTPSQPLESLNGHLAHSHPEHMLLDQLPYACLIGCRQ